MENLLTVEHLHTVFYRGKTKVAPVEDISLEVEPGETVGLVGESGCGKSITALSIMRLLGKNGKVDGGKVLFDGTDLLKLSEKQMMEIRGNRISIIFQEPMTSLNPIFTIGNQLVEAIRAHLKMGKEQAREYARTMLERVRIPRAEEVLREYPYMLSGGMLQRVIIAMALSCRPELLIADEPTTALDVTIQAQILRLMRELQRENHMSMILITHDLGVVAEMADEVLVVYAGLIVEKADVFSVFDRPLHPYTAGLMKSIPELTAKGQKLYSIPGTVPSVYQRIRGCRFCDRCPRAEPLCRQKAPPLRAVEKGHWVRCWMPEERRKP